MQRYGLTFWKPWALNLMVWSDLTLGPLLQGQTRIAKLKSAYNSLIVGPRGLQCQTNLQEIMSCKFSDVVIFDLGPLHRGQKRIVKLIIVGFCAFKRK